jgi:release factor glutamine methyltransferase
VDPLLQTLDVAERRLREAGVPDPRIEAELLLAELLGTDRGGLIVRRGDALDDATRRRYEDWVLRRASRVPFQHLTGTQEFFGLEFEVDSHVLIPRPETEGVVDAVLHLDLAHGARVADLGTGSGCVAISLATKREDFLVFALERSTQALQVARRNAVRHRVEERIELVQGDWNEPPELWKGALDAVVSNPPYVTEAEWSELQPEVREHDPREALVPGPTGLEAYAELIPAARSLLRKGGQLVVELGAGQSERVGEWVSAGGFGVGELRLDLNGIPRVLVATKR